MHLAFEVNGQRFVYALIRKNAYSAFANFLQDQVLDTSRNTNDLTLELKIQLGTCHRRQFDKSDCNFLSIATP